MPHRTLQTRAASRYTGAPLRARLPPTMPRTLATPCESLEIIQKSRFRVQAAPVASPEEALAFVQRVGDPTATHNCWAWKIGAQYRFSDDGEPGGTAGRPMLVALEGQDFDQVAVVVTRWFGGIKLGTGGLARAYGGATARCLQGAEAVPLVVLRRGSCHCRFAELALLKARLDGLGARLEQETYDAEGATLVLALPPEQWNATDHLLADLSRGRARRRPLDPA